MKKFLYAMIPYAAVLAVNFYLIPFLILDTGSAMFLMLLVMPLISLACAVVYGVRRGFDFILPVMAMILFFPTIFIYYNSSAWPYVIAHGVIALGGVGIGRIFHKNADRG